MIEPHRRWNSRNWRSKLSAGQYFPLVENFTHSAIKMADGFCDGFWLARKESYCTAWVATRSDSEKTAIDLEIFQEVPWGVRQHLISLKLKIFLLSDQEMAVKCWILFLVGRFWVSALFVLDWLISGRLKTENYSFHLNVETKVRIWRTTGRSLHDESKL